MSEAAPSPRLWSCPSCGRRVPLRAPVCHCGMTRERALEVAATSPAEASAHGGGAPAGAEIPRDVRALLAAAALVVAAGLGWAAFGPSHGDAVPPVLGWVDPGPPDPATLRARQAPPVPQPPFRLPWWK